MGWDQSLELSPYLFIKRTLYLLVLFLFGEPALTEENERLLCGLIQDLYFFQEPVRAEHAVVMTNLDLVQNAKVHSLYGERVLLQRVQEKLLLLTSSQQIICRTEAETTEHNRCLNSISHDGIWLKAL